MKPKTVGVQASAASGVRSCSSSSPKGCTPTKAATESLGLYLHPWLRFSFPAHRDGNEETKIRSPRPLVSRLQPHQGCGAVRPDRLKAAHQPRLRPSLFGRYQDALLRFLVSRTRDGNEETKIRSPRPLVSRLQPHQGCGAVRPDRLKAAHQPRLRPSLFGRYQDALLRFLVSRTRDGNEETKL